MVVPACLSVLVEAFVVVVGDAVDMAVERAVAHSGCLKEDAYVLDTELLKGLENDGVLVRQHALKVGLSDYEMRLGTNHDDYLGIVN